MKPMLTEPMETPIGVIGLGATALGLRLLELPRLGSEDDRPLTPSGPYDDVAAKHLAEAREQLAGYFDGTLTEFALALDWTGVSGLRLRVLKILADVPFGATTTYGELAFRAEAPTASQAVGGIMGSNPLPIVVPCHRVLAADGLGGFGGGIRTKEWLLAWEGVIPPALDWDQ
jgi:methylated-DNA-[protein]-cysteine S-methyltransferase